MTISASLLPEFDQEMKNTRTALARCPTEKLAWKPHPRSWEMGRLATHIARTIGWAVDALTKDSFDVAPPGAEPYKEEPAASTAELLQLFDERALEARSAIAATSDEDFGRTWSLLAGGSVIFAMPKLAVLRLFIFNHCVHHRGQLTVYLRLNDIPVPAIYGPSADENA